MSNAAMAMPDIAEAIAPGTTFIPLHQQGRCGLGGWRPEVIGSEVMVYTTLKVTFN